MPTSTDRFDPKVNRGTLPKDWARCSGCGSLRPEHALKTVEGEVRCADEHWCWWQTPMCGVHTGIASNRCLRPAGHAGAHDCQTVPSFDPAKPGSDRTVAVQVCTACGQVFPHVAACGATVDPELLGGG